MQDYRIWGSRFMDKPINALGLAEAPLMNKVVLRPPGCVLGLVFVECLPEHHFTVSNVWREPR